MDKKSIIFMALSSILGIVSSIVGMFAMQHTVAKEVAKTVAKEATKNIVC